MKLNWLQFRERVYPEIPRLPDDVVNQLSPSQYSSYLTWQLGCYERRIRAWVLGVGGLLVATDVVTHLPGIF